MVPWRRERSLGGREMVGRAVWVRKTQTKGEGLTEHAQSGWSIWYLGENQWEGYYLSLWAPASPESREALKDFKPGWQYQVRVFGGHEWTEEALDKVAVWGLEEQNGGKGSMVERNKRSQGQVWDRRNKSKALKHSPSWDFLTCTILRAAALPRWPAAVGFGCVKLGVEEELEEVQDGWAKEAGRPFCLSKYVNK